jgi:hypothetical protein
MEQRWASAKSASTCLVSPWQRLTHSHMSKTMWRGNNNHATYSSGPTPHRRQGRPATGTTCSFCGAEGNVMRRTACINVARALPMRVRMHSGGRWVTAPRRPATSNVQARRSVQDGTEWPTADDASRCGEVRRKIRQGSTN